MNSFRFETYENVVTKHHLGSGLNWATGARSAFTDKLNNANTTVVSVEQKGDELVIIKRIDQNMGFAFKYLNISQKGIYERVTIDRKKQTTSIDRMDCNWWHPEAFIGRRDFFYPETRGNGPEQIAFVRHDFWLFKLARFNVQMWSNFSAMSYKRAFKAAN